MNIKHNKTQYVTFKNILKEMLDNVSYFGDILMPHVKSNSQNSQAVKCLLLKDFEQLHHHHHHFNDFSLISTFYSLFIVI